MNALISFALLCCIASQTYGDDYWSFEGNDVVDGDVWEKWELSNEDMKDALQRPPRARGYGVTAAGMREKPNQPYDLEDEKMAVDWINAVLDNQLGDVSGEDNLQVALKDGVILCNLMNALKPGAVKKINPTSNNKWKSMENISNFLNAAEDYGCTRDELFRSVDLTNKENMSAVIKTIHSLARRAQGAGYTGPIMGGEATTVEGEG